jgi:sporulation protein YlmC with PRC-barrel domain
MGEIDIDTALDWRGRTVVDRAGEKIGTLKDIYLDEHERPSWGGVDTGLFAMRETLVPLGEARLEGDAVRLPYDEDHVKDAPNVDPEVQLSDDEEEQLYRHYSGDASTESDADETGAVAAGASRDAMTRSEEEVHIRKRRRERGRVRLKKYVVTDYVEKKVPVQREEVRMEYEPADDADRGK